MNSSQSQNIALIIIVFFGFDVNIVTSNLARTSRNPAQFSSDFMSFLQNLGSKVYKVKPRKHFEIEHDYETTTKYSEVFFTNNYEVWRSETNFNTQKDALRDALMMKLVSYYEDKYKLSESKPPTTPAPVRRNLRFNADKSSIHPLPTKRHLVHTRPTYSLKGNLDSDVEVI